ncbi:uncharacterized protein [Lepeophtheirus salmonis]|uniref:uncharacterized protein n=1 Tax=Lepeophtheirus salmonis TaxID=72036 RepID=UPI001AEA5810|nr:uncharacterized protein LOC121129566 [Lepeophtheirus salmonis]
MTTWFKLFVFLLNIPYLVMGMNCYICSRTVECRNRSYKDALESIQREEYIEGGNDAPMRRTEVIGNHNKYDLRHFSSLLNEELSWTQHNYRVKRQELTTPIPATVLPTNMTVTTRMPLHTNSSKKTIITNNPVRDAIYGGGILAAGAFVSILSITDALPNFPLPSESGGGVSPNQVTTDLQREALELTPINTIPLAVFPPFRTMRTFPAVAVIFKETTTSNSPRFLSLQWFRSLLPIFRRRSPGFFSSINLEDELVGYAVKYNYTCLGIDEFTCIIPVNPFKAKKRQGLEDFCTRSSPICRNILNTTDCVSVYQDLDDFI